MENEAVPQQHQLSEEGTRVLNAAFDLATRGELQLIDLINIADRLTAAGRWDLTSSLYRTFLEHTSLPTAYVAYFNYGVLLSSHGETSESEKMNRKALELNPDLIQARLNLGNNLEQQGRPEEALEQWRAALASPASQTPENLSLRLHALNNLGRLLESRRQFQEALQMLEQSISLDPSQESVILHLVHLRQKQCIWPVYAAPPGMTPEALEAHTSPLAMLAASNDPAQQLDAGQRFVAFKYGVAPETPLATVPYGHEKIRIGYLSSDLCLHAVSMLTIELFERHDRERFEVYAFCWSREDGTEMRRRVVDAMDHLIRIDAMGDAEAAACIRSHEIDVLVDLHGLTSGARPKILSYRPAPLQVTYLGFPGPTGLPWIDYVICDRFLIPEAEVGNYTEKPLYLPHCFQSSDSKRAIGALPTRAANNLPEDAVVFCSFNNNYKFTPQLFALWMKILKRVPKSVLWLLADNQWSHDNLCREAERHGVKRERLIFASRVAPPDYLARYQLADLFLDTFPFNGGTTANDALYMGLPLLTVSGRTFASRMAGSLLTHLGLDELIATDFADYERKAVALARKPSRLRKLKEQLLEKRSQPGSPFDMGTFIKDYEGAILGALSEVKRPAEPAPAAHQAPAPLVQTAPAGPPLTILLMAVNPGFFAEALGSVLSQTFGDYRLVVSDNSEPGTILAQFRDRFSDPRITWVHAWPQTKGNLLNHVRFLLDLVETPFFKFMHDDDILYQTSNAHLISLLQQNENVVCAFHGRHIINELGQLVSLSHWLPTGQLQAFTERQIAELVCKTAANLFGEVPFGMYRSTVRECWSAEFAGWPFTYIGDITSVLNIARLGWIAGSGAILGAYRRHGSQISVVDSPIRLSATVETDLLSRLLNARFGFSPETVSTTYDRLLETYQRNLPHFPILERFLSNLQSCVTEGRFAPDREFYELWREARTMQDLPVVDAEQLVF
ncbi:O-linked N-acetylglucosamine transferase family protein [Geomesophilobacter sediminis]|uniref:protein O-GlcNAc transferase n=1 Tax=Geomesophilobacter sediminis TaxID=2798584 RepID=A0A8J7M394_9BACT|nr:tetratricopeptide repeat protein [Geomesophilobacter sediminis]MBJ6727749.1 tetratricopeptide repeat protein [Geomesophilobacter sediminis]